jgi:hypothetical protein
MVYISRCHTYAAYRVSPAWYVASTRFPPEQNWYSCTTLMSRFARHLSWRVLMSCKNLGFCADLHELTDCKCINNVTSRFGSTWSVKKFKLQCTLPCFLWWFCTIHVVGDCEVKNKQLNGCYEFKRPEIWVFGIKLYVALIINGVGASTVRIIGTQEESTSELDL